VLLPLALIESFSITPPERRRSFDTGFVLPLFRDASGKGT
jgi:hypothetical protein